MRLWAAVLASLAIVSQPREIACDRLQALTPSELLLSVHPDFATATLSNGRGCLWAFEGEPCEFDATVEEDRRLGDQLRLVRVSSSHLRGSGAWDYIAVFGCADRRVQLVFNERFLYGVKIEQAEPLRLVLLGGYWAEGDGRCCPSKQKRSFYEWDAQGHRFALDHFDLISRESERGRASDGRRERLYLRLSLRGPHSS
jgi:hypothetical protein